MVDFERCRCRQWLSWPDAERTCARLHASCFMLQALSDRYRKGYIVTVMKWSKYEAYILLAPPLGTNQRGRIYRMTSPNRDCFLPHTSACRVFHVAQIQLMGVELLLRRPDGTEIYIIRHDFPATLMLLFCHFYYSAREREGCYLHCPVQLNSCTYSSV